MLTSLKHTDTSRGFPTLVVGLSKLILVTSLWPVEVRRSDATLAMWLLLDDAFNEASDSSVASLISEGIAKPTVLGCKPSLRPVTNSVDNIVSSEAGIY